MPRALPEEWINGELKSLNVVVDLGLKGCPVSNLVIFRFAEKKKDKKLGCRWLPVIEEETRPNQGRNKSGKRQPHYGTTGEEDPVAAGKAAIQWVIALRKDLDRKQEEEAYNSRNSLHHYWDIYWHRFNDKVDKTPRSKRDTLNRWNGKGWGIGEQEWSHKSVEEVNALDMEDYFKLLDARGNGKKGAMAKQKEGQKTLLNHLNKEARRDFPLLQPFIYPTIHKQEEEVEHFNAKEWQQLMDKVIELSGGAAKKDLTQKQYEGLEWISRSRFNQRNWVDFYDCLLLQWFFYLRPRDMPRLRSEWFKDIGEKNVRLYLEDTKQGRPKHETFHTRPDAYGFWKRMVLRRPKGYLAFPSYDRQEANESSSNVGATLNHLLQHAVDVCRIKKRKKPVWGIIRHTAFRLTLEEDPELGLPGAIDTFASNGHTSADMLRKKYLYHIDREGLAKKTQRKLKPSSWSLIKQVCMDEDE